MKPFALFMKDFLRNKVIFPLVFQYFNNIVTTVRLTFKSSLFSFTSTAVFNALCQNSRIGNWKNTVAIDKQVAELGILPQQALSSALSF